MKSIPTILLSFFILFSQNISGTTIKCNPEGSKIQLKGEASLSAVSPVVLTQPLNGKYKLIIKKSGYDTYKKKYIFNAEQPEIIEVNLKKKTRFKSIYRSMFIPGWGQRYSERYAKGFIYTALTVIAATGYFISEKDYYFRRDILDERKEYYKIALNSGDPALINYSLLRMNDAEKKYSDAKDLHQNYITALVSIYAVNLLDALFLAPSYDEVEQPKFSLSPVTGIEQTGLKLTLAF